MSHQNKTHTELDEAIAIKAASNGVIRSIRHEVKVSEEDRARTQKYYISPVVRPKTLAERQVSDSDNRRWTKRDTASRRPEDPKKAVVADFPFRLTDASVVGTSKVNIYFGMVNNIQPTSMDAVTGLTISITASGYVVLSVTCDAYGAAVSATITVAGSVSDNTETVGKIALGYVTVQSGGGVVCSQSVSNSLQHQKCGKLVHLFGAV